MTAKRTCESVRYAPRKACAEDGPKWDVVTSAPVMLHTVLHGAETPPDR